MQGWAKTITLNGVSISPLTSKQQERKNGILKPQMKLLTGKSTLAEWTKVLSQALIHLNVQSVGPLTPSARLGATAETPSTLKI